MKRLTSAIRSIKHVLWRLTFAGSASYGQLSAAHVKLGAVGRPSTMEADMLDTEQVVAVCNACWDSYADGGQGVLVGSEMQASGVDRGMFLIDFKP